MGGDNIEKKKEMKMDGHCQYHKDFYAMFVCSSCGKAICYFCQKNPILPHLCPECYHDYWLMKKKEEKKEKRIIMKIIIISIIIAFIIPLTHSFIFRIDYETYQNDRSAYIIINDREIFPMLDSQNFNATNRTGIDVTFKILTKNTGKIASGFVYCELYLIQNGFTEIIARGNTVVIEGDKSKPIYVNISLPTGEYNLLLFMWEDHRVFDKEMFETKVPSDLNEDISIEFEEFYYYRY